VRKRWLKSGKSLQINPTEKERKTGGYGACLAGRGAGMLFAV